MKHGAERRSTLLRARTLLPLSILGLLTVSVSGGAITGAFGYFTSNAEATMSLAVGGSIGVTWNDTAADSNVTLPIGPLMPADSVQRIVDLTNTGSVGLQQLQLSITNTGLSISSPSDGVQLLIDRCSVPWVLRGAAFTCSATTTIISPDRPAQARLNLADSPARTPAGLDHLRFTFRLSESAPESSQGQSGSLIIIATGSTA